MTKMGLKQRLVNVIATHPRLAMLGIGFAIATMVSFGLGTFGTEEVVATGGRCSTCYT
jgi:hypothetical protein